MKKNTVVEQIKEYIEKHLEEKLSLEIISKELNYSKFYMARVFAENMNCTIHNRLFPLLFSVSISVHQVNIEDKVRK